MITLFNFGIKSSSTEILKYDQSKKKNNKKKKKKIHKIKMFEKYSDSRLHTSSFDSS